MLSLTSNIEAVQHRLARRTDQVELAVRSALSANLWKGLLRHEAERTLYAIAQVGEQAFVARFVAGVMVVPETAGLGWLASLSQPWPKGGPVWPVQPTLPGTVGAKFDPIAVDERAGGFSRLLGDVYEWVNEEKRWVPERDGAKNYLSVMHKADEFTYLLIAPVLTEKQVQARDALLPHIMEFTNRRHQQQRAGLPPERIELWLRSVVAAWVELVRRNLPAIVQDRYERLRKEL